MSHQSSSGDNTREEKHLTYFDPRRYETQSKASVDDLSIKRKRKLKYVQKGIKEYAITLPHKNATGQFVKISDLVSETSKISKTESKTCEVLERRFQTLEVSSFPKYDNTTATSNVWGVVNNSYSIDHDYFSKMKLAIRNVSEPELTSTANQTKTLFQSDISNYMSDNKLGAIDEENPQRHFEKENILPKSKRAWNEISVASMVCPVLIRGPAKKSLRKALNKSHIYINYHEDLYVFQTCLAEIGENLIRRYIAAMENNSSFAEYYLLSCTHCGFQTESKLVMKFHEDKKHTNMLKSKNK